MCPVKEDPEPEAPDTEVVEAPVEKPKGPGARKTHAVSAVTRMGQASIVNRPEAAPAAPAQDFDPEDGPPPDFVFPRDVDAEKIIANPVIVKRLKAAARIQGKDRQTAVSLMGATSKKGTRDAVIPLTDEIERRDRWLLEHRSTDMTDMEKAIYKLLTCPYTAVPPMNVNCPHGNPDSYIVSW